jgi:HEAT repeat protein
VRALTRLRASEGEAVLASILHDREQPGKLRRLAGRGLGRLQTPSASAILVAALSAPDPTGDARAGAAEGLRQLQRLEAARPRLQQLVYDPNVPPLVRIESAHTLLVWHVPLRTAFVGPLLRHPNPEVRFAAACVAPLTQDEELWDRMFDALETEGNSGVRCALQKGISSLP